MKTLITAALLILTTACSSTRDMIVKDGEIQPTLSETFKESITEESVAQHIASWPQESREAYQTMFQKHGIPHGVTNDMLVWNMPSNRRAIIYKEGKLTGI